MIKYTMNKPVRQQGMSLMEMLIAMSISLVVSLAMVTLMANTLNTGKDTIGMSRLTSEMRAAMQIMTRDLRRANYHGNFAKCFGDWDCRSKLDTGDVDASGYVKPITITGGSCMFYWLDRDSDGNIVNDDDVGAFRRVTIGGVGVIQMTTTRNLTPSCNTGNYWTAITDPDVINVTNFTVANALSFTDTVNGADQTIDKIAISMTAQLSANTAIVRTINDTIRVRNDTFSATPVAP